MKYCLLLPAGQAIWNKQLWPILIIYNRDYYLARGVIEPWLKHELLWTSNKKSMHAVSNVECVMLLIKMAADAIVARKACRNKQPWPILIVNNRVYYLHHVLARGVIEPWLKHELYCTSNKKSMCAFSNVECVMLLGKMAADATVARKAFRKKQLWSILIVYNRVCIIYTMSWQEVSLNPG